MVHWYDKYIFAVFNVNVDKIKEIAINLYKLNIKKRDLLTFRNEVVEGCKKEIEGFEFASGIPGTVGGAIRMNAGAHGKEMKDVVTSITYKQFEPLIVIALIYLVITVCSTWLLGILERKLNTDAKN